MTDIERRFHETWLGMVQPVEGLVVSIPVLVDAQCMERLPPHVQQKLVEQCPPTRQGDTGPEGFAIADLATFLSEVLGLGPAMFDAGDALPPELELYVHEGRQTLRPTMALKKQGEAGYEMLVWDVPTGLDLDKPESITGAGTIHRRPSSIGCCAIRASQSVF